MQPSCPYLRLQNILACCPWRKISPPAPHLGCLGASWPDKTAMFTISHSFQSLQAVASPCPTGSGDTGSQYTNMLTSHGSGGTLYQPPSHANSHTTTPSNLMQPDSWADLDISGTLLATDGQMYELDLLHMDEQPQSNVSGSLWHDLDALGTTQYISAPPAAPNMAPHFLAHQNWLSMPPLHGLPPPAMQPPPPPPLEDDHPPPPRRRRPRDDDGDASAKPRRKISVTREWLEANGFFDMRARDAAMKLGIGVTTLKRYCRSDLQLDRWPWRKRVGGTKSSRKRPAATTSPPRRSTRRPFGADDEDEEEMHSSAASDHDEAVEQCP